MDEMMLDRILTRFADTTVYPATPRLRARVATSIAAPSRPARGGIQSLALAVAALCIAAAALLTLALPPSREAIADFFGIEGSRIERLPTPAPGTTPTPFPTPADISAIATPISIGDATQRLGFAPALPSGQQPSVVYVAPFIGPEPFVVLHFDRFDLWEGHLDEGYLNKAFAGATVLTDLTINGQPARWLSGGGHIVTFVDRDGNEIAASQRTVDRNTLVWRTPYAFYRIETDLSLDEIVAIAKTLP